MILLLDFCSFPWWLMWLLPFLLGLALGWAIWAKYKGLLADAEAKISGLNTRLKGLESDLGSCRSSLANTEGEIAIAKGKMREAEAELESMKNSLKGGAAASGTASLTSNTDTKSGTSSGSASLGNQGSSDSSASGKAGQTSDTNTGSGMSTGSANLGNAASGISNLAAGAAANLSGEGGSTGSSGGGGTLPYAKLKEDNLQIIEGIGPKMESVLHENDVKTWSDLASKSDAEVKAILAKYGDKYKIIDPSNWNQQAQLAAAGNWDQLITLQKQLDGNSATAAMESDSKLEKYMIKSGLIKQYKKDDLKAIEGIGPKTEELLHEAGIKTWKELAESSVDRIQAILDEGGAKFKLSSPGTWPRQAKLADEEKWQELQEYQDFLQGGKE